MLGQRLNLWAHPPAPRPKPLGPRFWTVRAGESFGSIAAKTGIDLTKLEELNAAETDHAPARTATQAGSRDRDAANEARRLIRRLPCATVRASRAAVGCHFDVLAVVCLGITGLMIGLVISCHAVAHGV